MRLQTLKARLQPVAVRVPVMQPGSWRTDKQNSTQRGYGYDWQKLRAKHLSAHPHCVYCLRDLGMIGMQLADVILGCARRGERVPLGNVVDHIQAFEGDDRLRLDPQNLQTLCKRHHDSDKQREEVATRFGRLAP